MEVVLRLFVLFFTLELHPRALQPSPQGEAHLELYCCTSCLHVSDRTRPSLYWEAADMCVRPAAAREGGGGNNMSMLYMLYGRCFMEDINQDIIIHAYDVVVFGS